VRRNEGGPSTSTFFPPLTYYASADACATMYHPGDVFAAHPGVQRIFDTFYLGTARTHRGRGLGHHLLQGALVVARRENCDVAVIFASSDGTRACIAKSGDWKPLLTRQWSEWKQPDGAELFPGIASTCATSHILWL
jgi:GNAT superfamily N-acetyltransferase